MTTTTRTINQTLLRLTDTVAGLLIDHLKATLVLDADEQQVVDALTPVFDAWRKRIATHIKQGKADDLDWEQFASDLHAAMIPPILAIARSETERFERDFGLDIDDADELEAVKAGGGYRVSGIGYPPISQVKGILGTMMEKIAQTTRKRVVDVAALAASTGASTETITSLLRPILGERRAKTIAVTEVTRAKSRAVARYKAKVKKQHGIELLELWTSMQDGRVRDEHQAYHDKVIPQGTNGKRPGDDPGCRCRVTLYKPAVRPPTIDTAAWDAIAAEEAAWYQVNAPAIKAETQAQMQERHRRERRAMQQRHEQQIADFTQQVTTQYETLTSRAEAEALDTTIQAQTQALQERHAQERTTLADTQRREREAWAPQESTAQVSAVENVTFNLIYQHPSYTLETSSTNAVGKPLTADDLTQLLGTQPGATIDLTVGKQAFAAVVEHPHYTQKVRLETKDNTITLSVKETTLRDDAPADLLQQVATQQVDQGQRLGVQRVSYQKVSQETTSTLADLGFDAPLTDKETKRLPPAYQGTTSLHDLYAQPGGTEAWRAHGSKLGQMDFDLAAGSPHRQRYQQAQEQAVTPAAETDPVTPAPSLLDGLDLSPEHQAFVEQARQRGDIPEQEIARIVTQQRDDWRIRMIQQAEDEEDYAARQKRGITFGLDYSEGYPSNIAKNNALIEERHRTEREQWLLHGPPPPPITRDTPATPAEILDRLVNRYDERHSNEHGRVDLWNIVHEQGFTHPPRVVDAHGFNQFLVDDPQSIEAFRGINAGIKRAEVMHQQFLSGEFYQGNGIYGNGMYTAYNGIADDAVNQYVYDGRSLAQDVAMAFSRVGGGHYIYPTWGVVQRIGIPGDARVTSYETLRQLSHTFQQEQRNRLDGLLEQGDLTPEAHAQAVEWVNTISKDYGMLAATHGYDAYTIPAGWNSGGVDSADMEPGQLVILNRSNLVVQEQFRHNQWEDRIEDMPPAYADELRQNEPPPEPPLPQSRKPTYPTRYEGNDDAWDLTNEDREYLDSLDEDDDDE